MEPLRSFYEWALSLDSGDIPAGILEKSRLQLLNMLAAAAEGIASGHGDLGSDPLFGITTASMVHDFDDFLLYSHAGHSSALVSLVLGAAADAPLRKVLEAQTAANELAGRLGACLLLGPHNGQMWSSTHIPSTLCAAGSLLGLDPGLVLEAVATCLAHAPYVAPGPFFSSSAKYYTASVPIRLSLDVLAALGARPGARSRDRRPNAGDELLLPGHALLPLKRFFSRPGRPWLTGTLHFKKYPGCAYLQGAVDAAVKADVRIEEIKKITARVDPLALAMEAMHRRHVRPSTPFPVRAAFSVAESVSASLVAGGFDCEVMSDRWAAEHRLSRREAARTIVLRPGPGGALRLGGRTLASVLLPGLGLRPADTLDPPPLELESRLEIKLRGGGTRTFTGRFPAYRYGDPKEEREVVAGKAAGAFRRLHPGAEDGEVANLVLGGGDVPARRIVEKSLGKRRLDSILKAYSYLCGR